MMLRVFSITLVIAAFGTGMVTAQEQGPDSIRKLAFLSGSWQCVIRGTRVPSGDVERLTYEFSPDWSWMIERSDLQENGRRYWGAQLWGYDARRKQLVAYQFSSNGVFTKSVDGWVGGRFQSTRNDDGATVSIVPVNKDAFNWLIVSADHTYTVTEACIR